MTCGMLHAVNDGMLHTSAPQAGVLSEQGQSQAGCAGGPAGGAARGSCQGPEANPSRRGLAEPGGCLRWGGCPGMLHAHYLACTNTHSFQRCFQCMSNVRFVVLLCDLSYRMTG